MGGNNLVFGDDVSMFDFTVATGGFVLQRRRMGVKYNARALIIYYAA